MNTGFLLASLNNTATFLFWASFVAFLVFTCHGIVFYNHAFWVMIVSLVVCFLTPNIEERKEFFGAAGNTKETAKTDNQQPQVDN
jgi:hypothetical protein